MAGGGRVGDSEYAVRVNAAVELAAAGTAPAEAARVLAARFGVSVRQARRYVDAAGRAAPRAPLPWRPPRRRRSSPSRGRHRGPTPVRPSRAPSDTLPGLCRAGLLSSPHTRPASLAARRWGARRAVKPSKPPAVPAGASVPSMDLCDDLGKSRIETRFRSPRHLVQPVGTALTRARRARTPPDGPPARGRPCARPAARGRGGPATPRGPPIPAGG